MFINCSEDFPNFFKLLAIVLTLLISTVYCERGFSYHNITKNKIRISLSPLRIMLEGEEIQNSDFDQVYKHWMNETTRLLT